MTDHKPLSEGEIATLPFTKDEQDAFVDVCFTAFRCDPRFKPARQRLSFDDLRTMSQALAGLMLRWQAERAPRKENAEIIALRAELASRTTPKPLDGEAEGADEYRPRTIERLIEILSAQDQNPRSWQQEVARAVVRSTQKEATEDARDAARYRYLRERDLDTIKSGGVFAGQTPENFILNGDDLDAKIDAAIAAKAGLRIVTDAP